MEGSVTTRTHWTSKQNLYWTREKIAHDRVRVLWSSVQEDCARLREMWLLMLRTSQFQQACTSFILDCSWWRGANERESRACGKEATWLNVTHFLPLLFRVGLATVTQTDSYKKLKIWLGERTTVGCQLRQHVHYYRGRQDIFESRAYSVEESGARTTQDLDHVRLSNICIW